MDRIFIVVFKGQHTRAQDSTATNKTVLSWRPLSRTEEIVITDKPDYGETVLRCVDKQFSLLQGPVATEVSSHLMFVLFKNEHHNTEAATGYNFTSQIIVGKVIMKREILDVSMGLFKFEMAVVDDRSLDISSSQWSIPKISLGIVSLTSPEISNYRMRLSRSLNMKPYAETAYSFRSGRGQVNQCHGVVYLSFSDYCANRFLVWRSSSYPDMPFWCRRPS
jgi:hypothetical protein